MYIKNSTPRLVLKDETTNSYKQLREALEKTAVLLEMHEDQNFYTKEVNFFLSIKDADIFVVCNKERELNMADTLGMLYAILCKKSIILLSPPKFSTNINLFARNLIETRLNKILLLDITVLDTKDLNNFINSFERKQVNYILRQHESIIIKSRLRAHFRSILSIG